MRLASVLVAALTLGGCAGQHASVVGRPTKQDISYMAQGVNLEIDDAKAARIVEYRSREKPGTIVVETKERKLYLVQSDTTAIRYPVAVGKEAYGWTGNATVQMKREWPDWHPPGEMRRRWPSLPTFMAGGGENPLGARALYLYSGGRDTLYRIHGTNDPYGIGTAVSSGCIRMHNEQVIDLYARVKEGTKVIVR